MDREGTEKDIVIYKAFAEPAMTPDAIVATYPAHMHINLLPEAQGKGWGRRLIIRVRLLSTNLWIDDKMFSLDSERLQSIFGMTGEEECTLGSILKTTVPASFIRTLGLSGSHIRVGSGMG